MEYLFGSPMGEAAAPATLRVERVNMAPSTRRGSSTELFWISDEADAAAAVQGEEEEDGESPYAQNWGLGGKTTRRRQRLELPLEWCNTGDGGLRRWARAWVVPSSTCGRRNDLEQAARLVSGPLG